MISEHPGAWPEWRLPIFRPKDRQDLPGTLPLMDRPSRQRLADALRTLHPGHEWIGQILDQDPRAGPELNGDPPAGRTLGLG
ncbi:MAG: hypothetical protein M3Z97_12205 [Candidatus Dormibacteraeota bacterium]|nr:hypothetical protein [Candidatus Dormibacteraeota bacterium]